jgi:rhodanese-related sulfurtransferase
MKKGIWFVYIPAILLVIVSISHQVLSEDVSQLSDFEKLAHINKLFTKYDKENGKAPYVTVQEAFRNKDDKNTLLVDARTEAEMEVSMLPNAISRDTFELEHKKHRDKKIIVYCTIGARSGGFVKKLRAKDFEAFNLKGGILLWAHAGKSFIDNMKKETKTAHVYGYRWNLLPKGYTAVTRPAAK